MAENSKVMLKTCMNEACRVTYSSGWKIGWELKSGGFALLCVRCGIAYAKSTFCNIFHKNEEGWRGCRDCGKRVHCGCPASKTLLEILDLGGVRCSDCVNHVRASTSNPSRVDVLSGQVDVAKVSLAKDHVETGTKRKYISETGTGFYTVGSQKLQKTQKSESQASTHQKNNDEVMVPVREQSNMISFENPPATARCHQYIPWDMSGRGRYQMLNQYWPRTSPQELQQISANLKSAIVPLFEKILSPTDVGRMDRLVLPKHCTEAYFPPVYEMEGLPIKIQDVMGVEWTFLFRFWQNNGSRMYVLEGFSSFVKKMQLRARDTVTFSCMDPSGRLVMGFRKLTRDSKAGCGSSSNTVIEPPAAIFTVKPPAPNEIHPKGQATLNEGYKADNKDSEASGLEILATTALLTENIENTEHPQLPDILYID